MKKYLILKIIILFLFISFVSVAQSEQLINNINVSAGIPVKQNDSNYFIIDRSQYVVSVSKELSVPNWAAYYLCNDDFGKTKRYSKNFITDTTLPVGYYRVKHSDYTNSGYDRGHLVRSDDRTKSDTDNIATFYLTNIIPQTPDLNRLVWLQFENYLQQLCKKDKKHLYIVCGGAYYTGKTIKNNVGIPDSCWKVVLVLDSNQTIKDVTNKTLTIAVMMPNEKNLKGKKWTEYVTTVRNIENATGYNFFSNIDITLQDAIENKLYKSSIKKE